MLVDEKSLGVTVENFTLRWFDQIVIPMSEKNDLANWLVSRQGLPKAYANMFAPTEQDLKYGIKLFTGEKITSGAAISHILGEESCRILRMLKIEKPRVVETLEKANAGMLERLKFNDENPYYKPGMYCCGNCTVAMLRYLAVGGLNDNERRIKSAIAAINRHRDHNGSWKTFPFFYTLLTLFELNTPEARAELLYTKPRLEKIAIKGASEKAYQKRRRRLAERILSKL